MASISRIDHGNDAMMAQFVSPASRERFFKKRRRKWTLTTVNGTEKRSSSNCDNLLCISQAPVGLQNRCKNRCNLWTYNQIYIISFLCPEWGVSILQCNPKRRFMATAGCVKYLHFQFFPFLLSICIPCIYFTCVNNKLLFLLCSCCCCIRLKQDLRICYFGCYVSNSNAKKITVFNLWVFLMLASAFAFNRPLPSSKNPHFQNEPECTIFLVKMSYICMRMKNHFHIKSWALNLVLIQRPGGTRKWHIHTSLNFSCTWVVQWRHYPFALNWIMAPYKQKIRSVQKTACTSKTILYPVHLILAVLP